MKTYESCLLVICLSPLFCSIASCGSIQEYRHMALGPPVDIRHDKNGSAIFPDTSRNWQDFVMRTDISIRDEAAGETHWGASKNANDAWVKEIQNMPKYREHPQRYINYIIEARRRASLPELKGYPGIKGRG